MRWIVLFLFIVVTQAAGAAGAVVTDPDFYRALERPWWAPPGWLFAPVWLTLYTMMGFAAWRIWETGPGRFRTSALVWYAVQLAINAAWTPVFFGLRSLGGGLAVIVVLWFAIVATIVAFERRSRLAAALLLPYLAWVTFATALNAAVWALNRG